MTQRWQTAGFTIIEVMIVVIIIGIVTAMAAPSLRVQITNMQLRDNANLIESSLKQARSDALVYRSPVSVTFSGSSVAMTQTGNSNYPQNKTLNDVSTPVSATLTFSSNKSVNVPDSGLAITVISNQPATDKYKVTVNKLANISQCKVKPNTGNPGECI